MDTQWLLTFDKILKTGTFAKAAEELGYTQSTVSFHIRQLEQELSMKLFDKIGRRMQLSEAGRAIIPLVQEAIESSEKLKNAGQNQKIPVGKLTISVSDGIFKITPLYDVIEKFLETAPQVDLTVSRKPCSDTIEALKDGSADIGILFQVDGLEDPALNILPLKDIHMILVASATVNPDWDLENLPAGKIPFFLTDPRCAFHGVYKRYLKHHKLPSNIDTVINDWTSCVRGVKSGLGITLAPREQLETELAEGSVRIIPMMDLQERAYIALAVHKNKGESSAIHLIMQLAQQYIHN